MKRIFTDFNSKQTYIPNIIKKDNCARPVTVTTPGCVHRKQTDEDNSNTQFNPNRQQSNTEQRHTFLLISCTLADTPLIGESL